MVSSADQSLEKLEVLTQFLAHHPGLAFIKDDQGRYLYANAMFGEFFGIAVEDIIGKTDYEWLPEELALQFTKNDELVRQSRQSVEVVEVVPQDDGTEIYSLVNKFPIVDRTGRLLVGGTAIDISRRVRAENALRESQSRLALALEASGTGTWDWDIQSGVIRWDKHKHQIFGLEDGQFDGSVGTFLNFVHQNDRQRVENAITLALVDQTDYETEFRIVRPDDSVRHVSMRGRVFRDPAGKALTMAGVCTDVSDRRHAEEHAKLVALLRQRENFMATLTHDLKNPLLGAERVLELFVHGQLGHLTAEQLNVLKKLRGSNRALLGLIQNLLEVYRIENEPQTMTLPDVEVSQLVTSYLSDFGTMATDRDITIVADLPEQSPMVKGNISSLRRVIHNLMDNAIKFTPPGGTITVRAETSNNVAVLEVEDTGPGISAEDQKELFRKFWRNHEDCRPFSSTGLGLYLCRQIVESHEGTISCISGIGKGSIFRVELPLQSTSPKE